MLVRLFASLHVTSLGPSSASPLPLPPPQSIDLREFFLTHAALMDARTVAAAHASLSRLHQECGEHIQSAVRANYQSLMHLPAALDAIRVGLEGIRAALLACQASGQVEGYKTPGMLMQCQRCTLTARNSCN